MRFLLSLKMNIFFFTAQISKKVENNKRNPKQKGISFTDYFP
tara:strand:+ start:46 stop:171 length:126 start_codon:yes stop_codon:yes gene_type:complete